MPDTVNTIPPKTLEIFRKQGRVIRSLEKNLEAAQQVLTSLAELGISMDQVTQELEQEGVRAFVDAYVSLLQTIYSRRAAVRDG